MIDRTKSILIASVFAWLCGVTAVSAHDLLLEGPGSFGGLMNPQDIAVDSVMVGGGFVHIADTDQNRIHVFFPPDLTSFLPVGNAGTGNGEFQGPRGVTVDSAGNIYVADTGNDRIQKFDKVGNGAGFIDVFPPGPFGLSSPHGLGVDSSDRIYVADTGNDRVQIFDSGGAFINKIGTEGDGPGEFQEPVDVAVCPSSGPFPGRIYVVDRARENVQVFDSIDSGGAFLFAFGKTGSGFGRFSSPSGIAVDHLCVVYVADTGNDRTQIFDPNGGFLEAFSDGQNSPAGVAAESILGGLTSGVYVSNTGQDSVQKYEWVNILDPDDVGLPLDSDGDGLLDVWEIDGIDINHDGVVDLDLPALGADPLHKDIFVEVDFMEFHDPDGDALADVISAFANAPVNNPDGVDGINLHVETDEQIAHVNEIQMWLIFDNIKSQRFGTSAQRNHPTNAANILAAKKLAYHYSLFVHDYCTEFNVNVCTGPTSSSGLGELNANDFIVSMGSFKFVSGHQRGDRRQQRGTFMHELGHNLGLDHGGGDKINCKPNYVSIMNYSFQLRGIPNPMGDLFNPSINMNIRLDYSSEVLDTLNESSLLENDGIGDGTDFTIWSPDDGGSLLFGPGDMRLDWNGDNAVNDPFTVSVDVNNLGKTDCGLDGNRDVNTIPGQTLKGFNDWDNIDYNFRDNSEFADGAHEEPSEIRELPAEDDDDVEPPEGFFCDGVAATIVGTEGNDILRGTDGDDVIKGLGGSDAIFGGGGNDIICGGDGSDKLSGGGGDDMIDGGRGRDALVGGRGNDILSGGPDRDTLFGRDGEDTLIGGEGDDRLRGGRGSDNLGGGPGDDRLDGDDGDDTLNGGSDTDSCDGGNGTDTAADCEEVAGVP
jgi:hypothetical protein